MSAHTPPAPAETAQPPHFLAGGGEMGRRMRELDWTRTALGAPQDWPQSLKTIVRVLLDSRYAMWMLWGPDLTFFCNDAYLPTVGIKRDWVLGARSDKVWEEIWPDIGPRIQHVLKSGEATWDEALLLYLERSGFTEESYHTFSYSPVYDDNNRIAGMLCVVTEVTERIVGERRLRVLRDLAARAVGAESVQQACDGLFEVLAADVLDVPFACIYMLEEGGQDAWLAATAGTIPKPLRPLVISAENPVVWPLGAAIGTDRPMLLSLPGGTDAVYGSLWPDRVQQALVLAVQGPSTPAAVLIMGVSPRRPLDDRYRGFYDLIARQFAAALADAQASQASRRRAESLAELDRAKTTFFSNVSHEFRTPLTLMLGPIEAAVSDPTTPAGTRRQLEVARRNSRRLLKLVNSLLDFSRIEAGRVQASFEPTDIVAVTQDLASTFRSAIESAGLEFRTRFEHPAQAVYLDREMWEKIVLNLLSNAFKFTMAGHITLALRDEGLWVCLEIADTGVGIPEHELPRLFERFHRVEGSVGRSQEGSGIGLALVQELVRMHGGRVDVQSILGRGTTFQVHIPCGTEHLPPDRIRAPRELSSTAVDTQAYVQEALGWVPVGGAVVPDMSTLGEGLVAAHGLAGNRGARIVLADDNADMRTYVTQLLAPRYQVEALADGEQALHAIRRDRPVLIITDVMMPNLDGFGLLRALRTDASLRSIPVILLSARAGEESRIEGLEQGADEYLAKPFSARELTARVRGLVELERVRRESMAALRQRTLQYETLLDLAPLGVFVVDADFRLRQINPIALPLFGGGEDLIGRDFEEVAQLVWPDSSAREVVQLFRRTLASGEAYEAAERLSTRRSGSFYEWQISRIPLPDGRDGAVCYFRDISAHVLARNRLEIADRQKNEFLAMLAHELRNPLAAIRNAGELMSRTVGVDARTPSVTDMLQRQVGVLVRLVDDLLDVSRITQGRIVLKKRTVQLADIVAQAMETVDPLIQEKKHRIAVVSYKALRVNADPTRLVQCVVNVLTNAAKYTQSGGEIRIELAEEDGAASITVSDNGPGISADLLPHVFDLFVQSERTLERAHGGLGIGLSLVKRLVEMHGGSVTASSAGTDCGSSFVIRLPLSQVEVGRSGEVPRLTGARRILIVDDNEDAADSLGMLLDLEGHHVEISHSSTEALERVQQLRPDVVLLDIGLPELDGYEVARRMRATPELKRVRLVALTGYGQAEDKQRAQAAGFDDHLVKPVEFPALQRVLAASTP